MFKVGDYVTWYSAARGTWREKTGEVVEIVPANMLPTESVLNPLVTRGDVSYVVRIRGKLYWPRAKFLKKSEVWRVPNHL